MQRPPVGDGSLPADQRSKTLHEPKEGKRSEGTKRKERMNAAKLIIAKKKPKPRSKRTATKARKKTPEAKTKTKRKKKQKDVDVAAGTSNEQTPSRTARNQRYFRIKQHCNKIPSSQRVTVDAPKEAKTCHATVVEPRKQTLPEATEFADSLGQVSDQGQPDSDSDSDLSSQAKPKGPSATAAMAPKLSPDGDSDSNLTFQPKAKGPLGRAVAPKRSGSGAPDRDKPSSNPSAGPKRNCARRKRKEAPVLKLDEAQVSDQGQADSDSDSSFNIKGPMSQTSETSEKSIDSRSRRSRKEYRRFVKAARREAQRFANNLSDFDRYDISVLPARLRQDFPDLDEDAMLECFNRMLEDPAFVYTLF